MSYKLNYMHVNILATKIYRESVEIFERKRTFQNGWRALQPMVMGSKTQSLRFHARFTMSAALNMYCLINYLCTDVLHTTKVNILCHIV
jgi:hypothetical protein